MESRAERLDSSKLRSIFAGQYEPKLLADFLDRGPGDVSSARNAGPAPPEDLIRGREMLAELLQVGVQYPVADFVPEASVDENDRGPR